MTALILLVIGLCLIFLEFFLPGAVIGTIGVLLLCASIVVFAMETDSVIAVILYCAAVIVALIYLIKFALWRIKKTKFSGSIYLDADQEGFVASTFDQNAIGKTGTVLTDLKPGGYILVDGKKLQALSVEGYISQGAIVKIVGGQEESLLVKLIHKEES